MHALRLTRRAAMAARVPFRPNSYRVLMRVHVVSDVHGSTDALARAGEDADALFCLGDLILFVDYADNSQGIFADLFGAEQARKFIALRTARRFDEARALSARLWAGLPGDPAKHVEAAVSRQYAVGGGLHSPYRTPNEIDDDVYEAKVAAVGTVDVVCTHIPPAVPQLLYDTVARRLERGSEALLQAIIRTRPRYVLFGHVHQPLVSRARIGTTECINVGHFRATRTPYVLEW